MQESRRPWTRDELILNSELGKYKIVFKGDDRHSCPKCNGNGFIFVSRRVAGSSQTETSKSYSLTWERVWDTKTNSYKEVRGTKETTATKTRTTGTSTYDEEIRCSNCNGAGKFSYMIWNAAAFNYRLKTG